MSDPRASRTPCKSSLNRSSSPTCASSASVIVWSFRSRRATACVSLFGSTSRSSHRSSARFPSGSRKTPTEAETSTASPDRGWIRVVKCLTVDSDTTSSILVRRSRRRGVGTNLGSGLPKSDVWGRPSKVAAAKLASRMLPERSVTTWAAGAKSNSS